MPATLTRDDIRVLDPETYANGDPTTFGLPLEQYRWLRDNEPVSLREQDNPMFIPRIWVLTRHADCTAVDRNPKLWAANIGPANIWLYQPIGESVGAPGVIVQDGAEHTHGRRILGKAFTPTMIARLEQQFREIAREVVSNALAQDGAFDFIDVIGDPMPMRALGDVIGIPDQDRPKFFGWVDKFAAAFDERITPSPDVVMQAIMELHAYALELRDYKLEHPGDDVMTRVAQSDMTDGEVKGNVTLLASGAAESTRNSLAHGLHELMRNEEQMTWLRARANDIPTTAVQEIVRVASPFTHFVRFAREDTEIHGQQIAKGEPVLILFAAANFDERAIEDPETFDLSRDPNPHLAFGRGPHSCLGKHIAAMEIKVLLEEFLQRTSDIRPAGEISYIKDNYSRGVYHLPIEIAPA